MLACFNTYIEAVRLHKEGSLRWSYDCTDIFSNDILSIGLESYTGMCKSLEAGAGVVLIMSFGV